MSLDPHMLLDMLNFDRPAALPAGALNLKILQENVFSLTVGSEQYLVKWIDLNNIFGQNELRTGRLFLKHKEIPAPRLIFEKTITGGTIAGWEWLVGHDLRYQERIRMAEAFARLGRLHRELRNQGQVVMPGTYKRFATIDAMLEEEARRLCAPFDADIQQQCLIVLDLLKEGYPTLTHGDMHPGNVIVSSSQVWFVDWSYACNSINLFDLDYVDSIPMQPDGPAWTQITPTEAAEVLPAYFSAAGLEHLDPFLIHRAVMVWTRLRSYENAVKNGYRAEAGQVREQLFELLSRI